MNIDALTAREDTRTLVLHDLAADTVGDMFAHCELIRTTFGAGTEYLAAVTSLHHCLVNLLRKGFGNHAYVTRDGDLSLYVQEEGFVFGVIFHRNRNLDGTPHEGIAGEWNCHS